MTTVRDAAGWARGLDDVVDRIAARFGRVEPRRARACLHELLAPVERKDGWRLAEEAGDPAPDGVQEFLSRVHWDAEAVRDDLRAKVIEHLGDPGAVLVIDETGFVKTGFVKKGTGSVGMQRRYSGTAGRVPGCGPGSRRKAAATYWR